MATTSSACAWPGLRIDYCAGLFLRHGARRAGGDAAIDQEGLAGDVCAGVRRQENHRAIEVVRLAPEEGESERSWRHRRLPRSLVEQGCLGLHSPVSAFPVRGPGRRVQTVHELPWKHGAAENADLRHRFWAALGTRRADRVICPSEHVARDLGRRGGTLHVCPWGAGPELADEPPPGVVDDKHLVSNGLDLLPTVCDYAGVKGRSDPRGLSVRAIVDRKAPASWRTSLGVESEIGRMVVGDKCKYIKYDAAGAEEQLLDLKADPLETRHFTNEATHAKLLARMRKEFARWFPNA